MRVRIDGEACVGDGTCVEVCPEIFEMAGEIARVKMEKVPDELQKSCREAADECVVEAIMIEE
ncbi:MAG TPA: ferredoxin [Syntrophorhabdales bacterium]|nr:ferredoxin [Syntrophorhabdales bacterium]